MRNILLVLSGPSGVGKGTIAKKLVEQNPDIALSVSCTTRLPREGEVDGKDYFFVTKDYFEKKINEDGFLEYSNHFENYYGTPKDFVLDKLNTNDVLLEIDVNGGLNVKKSFSDAILIMVLPPSVEEVKNRLMKRHTESPENIELRMQRIKYEISKQTLYDYSVVNDDLDETVKQLENIIKNEKNK